MRIVNGKSRAEGKEKGAAIVIAMIIIAILSVVAVAVLALSASEARIAGSDLLRSQTFYASVASMEKMTNDFSSIFRVKISPTNSDLTTIAASPPSALVSEGFVFSQTIAEDTARLDSLRAIQGLPSTEYPRVNIPEGTYAGLTATIIPYKLNSKATHVASRTEVRLEREVNNYLVPVFQFGIFSTEDLEFHPGPLMTFNGRIHSNGNIYALRNVKFLSRLTTGGEIVHDVWRSGLSNIGGPGANNVSVDVSGVNVNLSQGSVIAGGGTPGGPNFTGSILGSRGYNPGSPLGIANPLWETNSILPAVAGVPDRFGGQVLTNTTGGTEMKLPLELEGNSAAELIKRSMPTDSAVLAASRYHKKAQIRILLDDVVVGVNVGGIPVGKGVDLSTFQPTPLGSGSALRLVNDSGSYSTPVVRQGTNAGPIAGCVRTSAGVGQSCSDGSHIPSGAGLNGRIYIEIVKPDGTTVDATQAILSMGITEGEPNAIVQLQRPLWAAYMQGSRDRSGNGDSLVSVINSGIAADGELVANFNPTIGYFNTVPASVETDGAVPFRDDSPSGWNAVVPINIYNVREGWVRSNLNENRVYERGMMSIVELNMKNIARWADGVYDSNLLSGTNAVSTNIAGAEGYVVYVSDRRGDKIKNEKMPDGSIVPTTNGIADNEDIYGANGALEAGEDVIDFGFDVALGGTKKGSLQRDTSELPDTGNTWDAIGNTMPNKQLRAQTVMQWTNPTNYFRRGVRLFNGDSLTTSGAVGKLSNEKGLTVASENMVYVWGNYNTTGVSSIPVGSSTLNDGSYLGVQVPTSIVCDALFPLSKTWFDALGALHPEGVTNGKTGFVENGDTAFREADAGATLGDATAVRAGIIAGTNLSAISGIPGRDSSGLRLSGGIANYPRFLEQWNWSTSHPWSFTGSFIPLFHSTQAMSQWENATGVIYMPPRRNWSFDTTFRDPNRLPPGTPFFQYLQTSAFRQILKD